MAKCVECGEVLHRVLKGRLSGRRDLVLRGVVKCQECGRISEITIRETRARKVTVILSWMDESKRIWADMAPDSVLRIGDQLDIDQGKAEVTAIESDGRRVPYCLVTKIDTVWAKRADKVRVKVTILMTGKASSRSMIVAPETEFCIGDVIEVGKTRASVEHIKIEQRTLRRGCATAGEIKRIYARALKSARIRRSFS